MEMEAVFKVEVSPQSQRGETSFFQKVDRRRIPLNKSSKASKKIILKYCFLCED